MRDPIDDLSAALQELILPENSRFTQLIRDPLPSIRTILLQNQDFKCIYCYCKLTIREAQIEHFKPYVIYKHKTKIYVACRLCNRIKGTTIFETLEEAREYIEKIRNEKMRKLSEGLSADQKTSAVLQEEMSLGKMGRIKSESKQKCMNCIREFIIKEEGKIFCSDICRNLSIEERYSTLIK